MKRRPRKRTDWKARCEEVAADLDACEGCLEEANQWVAERKKMLFDAHNQIVKLKEERGTLLDTIFELQLENYALREDRNRLEREKEFWAKRAEFNGELCDKAQARVHSLLIENEQQNVNILAQQKKLIELRGKPEERISC